MTYRSMKNGGLRSGRMFGRREIFFLAALAFCGAFQFINYLEIARPFLADTERSLVHMVVRVVKIGVYAAFDGMVLFAVCALLRHRSRPLFWGCLLAFSLFSLFSIANRLYCRYYGDLIYPSRFADIRYAPDIANQFAHQIIGWRFPLQILLFAIAVFLLFRSSPRRGEPSAQLVGFVLAAVVGLNVCMVGLQLYRFGSISSNRLTFGLLQNAYYFGATPAYLEVLGDGFAPAEDEVEAGAFPGTVNADAERLEGFRGAARGVDHVFILQVESLDVGALEYRSGEGRPLMPFVNAFLEKGLYHPRFFAHHNGGGSSSAELATLFSLIPVASHNGFFTARYDEIGLLNRVLGEAGFESFFFHPNRGNFFGRNVAYEKMGFDHFCDSRFFTGDAEGWYAKDGAFLEDSLRLLVDKRSDDASKLFAYFVTIQAHGPFRNYDEATARELGAEMSEFAGLSRLEKDYAASMREVDRAIECFFDRIDELGLGNALVIVFADHSSGVMNKPEGKVEPIPLLIHYPGVEPRRLSGAGSLIDVAPTTCDLLDLEPAGTWIGDSLLQVEPRTALFVDGTALTQRGESTELGPANKRQRSILGYSSRLQQRP